MKVDNEQLIAAIRRVIARRYPAELDAYDLACADVLSQAELSIQPTTTLPGQYPFLADATAVLTFIQVLITASLALKKLAVALSAEATDLQIAEFQKDWEAQLMQRGLGVVEAKGLAAEFGRDVVAALRANDQGGPQT
jgi:hypothetical protein